MHAEAAVCKSVKKLQVYVQILNMENVKTAAETEESHDGDLEKYKRENEKLKQIYRDQKERIRQLKVSLIIVFKGNDNNFSLGWLVKTNKQTHGHWLF